MTQPPIRTSKLPGLFLTDGEVILSIPASARDRYAILTLLLASTFAAQQVLTQQEQAMLRALLDASPVPCSYAVLDTALVEIPEEQADIFMKEVRKGEVLDIAMKLVRDIRSPCRVKLEPFNLDSRSVDTMTCGLFR